MSGCERCADAVGHAFSALEPDEDRAVLEHLPHCAECRRALDEALEIVAALGAAVPSVEPPARLRGRVLEAVRAEPAPPLQESARRGTAAPAIPPDPPAGEPARPTSDRGPGGRGARCPRWPSPPSRWASV